MASNEETAANTDFDLEYTIEADQADFYDDDYEIAFRVYQFNPASSLSVDLFCLHFVIVYVDKYTTKTNVC